MARQTKSITSRAVSLKATSRIPLASEIRHDFFGLLGCAYRVEPKGNDVTENRNILDCIATLFNWDEEESILGFTTEIRALKHSTTDGAGYVSATYLVTLRLGMPVTGMSASHKQETARLAINLLVMQNFKSLYNTIVGQSVARFAELPNEVDPIRWMNNSDFDKETISIPMPLKPSDKKPAKKPRS